MTSDSFAILGRIASNPQAFGPATDMAREAAKRIAVAAVAGVTQIDVLVAIGSVLGNDIDDLLSDLRAPQATAVLKCVDPHGPKPTPADGKGRLVALARGAAPTKAPAPVTDIATLDLQGLIGTAVAKGEGFGAWLASQPVARRKAALARYDAPSAKHVGDVAASILKRLTALAHGARTVASRTVADVTLDGLRAFRHGEPETFDAWAAWKDVRDAAKDIVKAIDPGYPNAARLAAPAAVARLRALAEGAPTITPVDIDRLDVDGLRKTRADMGDTFEAWLKAIPAASLKATLGRLDPHRPKVGKLQAKEYPFLLRKIAEGEAPVASESEARVIGERAFPVRA